MRCLVEIDGAGYSGKGGNARRRGWIAGQDGGEASAVRLAGRVYTRWIDAVAVQNVIEKFEGEGYITDILGRVRIALPLIGMATFCALFIN